MRSLPAEPHSEFMTARFILKSLTLSDFALAAWVGFCILLSVLIGREVRELGRFGTTMDQTANALEEISSALEAIAEVPLVGGSVGEIAGELAATADRIRESASDTRSAADNLSVLLAIAVAIVPTAPVIALYVPYRTRQIRETSELLRSIHSSRNGAHFARNYLANRALNELTYDRLSRLGHDPWALVRQGNVDRLAREELKRLGLEEELPALSMSQEEADR